MGHWFLCGGILRWACIAWACSERNHCPAESAMGCTPARNTLNTNTNYNPPFHAPPSSTFVPRVLKRARYVPRRCIPGVGAPKGPPHRSPVSPRTALSCSQLQHFAHTGDGILPPPPHPRPPSSYAAGFRDRGAQQHITSRFAAVPLRGLPCMVILITADPTLLETIDRAHSVDL